MSDLSWKDRVRIEWAVQRLDFMLDARVPRARRRQIRNELRSNLTEAARQVGAREAVGRIGDLRALAASYVEVYRGRFDFRAGSWAVIATFAALQILSFAVFVAFSSGVLASGGHGAGYSFWNGFGPFAGSASSHGFDLTILSPAHLVLMAIAFVIGSAHRQIRRR